MSFAFLGLHLNAYLDHVCGYSRCASYSTIQGFDYILLAKVLALFFLTENMMWTALALAIVALVFVFLYVFWPRIGAFKVGLLISGISAAFLLLVAPVNFVMELSSIASTTATGNTVDTTNAVALGAGFYATFVAFALVLIGLFLSLRAVKALGPIGNISLRNPINPTTSTLPPKAGLEPGPEPLQSPTLSPTMYCKLCGAKIPRDSKFCKECGSNLVEE